MYIIGIKESKNTDDIFNLSILNWFWSQRDIEKDRVNYNITVQYVKIGSRCLAYMLTIFGLEWRLVIYLCGGFIFRLRCSTYMLRIFELEYAMLHVYAED